MHGTIIGGESAILILAFQNSIRVVEGKCGIGRLIMDVSAPTAVIWKQLLDFPTYPTKVPVVVKSEVVFYCLHIHLEC